MKKLILIFGVFLVICVIVSSVAEQKAQTVNETVIADVKETENEHTFIVKSENGRIVVYRDDELLMKTSTAVSTLPKIDQRTLLYGIAVSSKQELEQVLANYCS